MENVSNDSNEEDETTTNAEKDSKLNIDSDKENESNDEKLNNLFQPNTESNESLSMDTASSSSSNVSVQTNKCML